MKYLYTGFLILFFSNNTFSQFSVDPFCDSLQKIRNCINTTIYKADRLYLDSLTKDLNEMVGKDRDGSHPELFKKLSRKLDAYSNSLQSIDTTQSGECYVKIVIENFKYEFSNYKLGMSLLKDEIEKVQGAKFAMLPIINYKNAFFNLLRSKSQLEAALGQYVGLIDGKVAAKELANSMQMARDTIRRVNDDIILVKDVSGGMDSTVTFMKVGLDSTFIPYTKKLSKNTKELLLEGKNGKIETASNVILYDARRNNWWRAAIGGLAGGLIAGLIIGLVN